MGLVSCDKARQMTTSQKPKRRGPVPLTTLVGKIIDPVIAARGFANGDLIAAWRNMMANRLISAIAILGLSVGIAAALLMGLVVRNQMTFDHFIPGYARTYAGISGLSLPGRPTDYNLLTPADIAGAVKAAGGPELDKRRIEVTNPIKTVGAHNVAVRLHPEVSAKIALEVIGT